MDVCDELNKLKLDIENMTRTEDNFCLIKDKLDTIAMTLQQEFKSQGWDSQSLLLRLQSNDISEKGLDSLRNYIDDLILVNKVRLFILQQFT